MKVTNWRRKLAVALLAGGLFTSTPAVAADLNTNLVIDPGFENVDTNDPGPFTGVRLLDWSDTTGDDDDNFAYPYSSNYSGNPAPLGAGDYHFTGGFATAEAATVNQQIDVSTGDTSAVIAEGNGGYQLSGFFSSYRQQGEASFVQIRFLDSGGTALGSDAIGGPEFVAGLPITGGQVDWGQDVGRGTIPVGTATVDLQLIAGGGATNYDGYVDLVDFRIGPAEDFVVVLQVDRATGAVTLQNNTGEDLLIDYYEITSASGSLNSAGWNSLQDQDLNEFPAGDGSGNGWEEAGGSSSGSPAADFNNSGIVDGADFDIWQDGFATLSGATKADGDADGNGAVDGLDLLFWQRQLGSSGSGGPALALSESFLLGSSRLADQTVVDLGSAYDTTIDADDLVFRLGVLDNENDTTSTLVTGLVRYVISESGGATTVPEPATLVFVGVACCALTLTTPQRPARHQPRRTPIHS